MAELMLFHHAQGLTPGVLGFAEDLRAGGHVVHTPDLYDGTTFTDIGSGVSHAEAVGFDVIIERGMAAASGLDDVVVYAGFSLGVLPAQKLAQTRSGARGALLYHAGVPTSAFGSSWPDGVALQMHVMADDDWGDLADMQSLEAEIEGAELFVYLGSTHLFADSSLPDYDEKAAHLLLERSLDLLNTID